MPNQHQESILSENLRKKRLQSPGHIHDYVKVTSVSIFMISITCIILLVALTVWAFMGTMTDKKNYEGIVFPQNGVTDVIASSSGTIKKMLVHNGDRVRRRQSVAVLNINGKEETVYTDREGIVLNTRVEGTSFSANDIIVSTVTEDKNLWIMAYVDNKTQRVLQKGMKAQIWPSDESPDNIGYFTGTIISVSNYPVPKASVQQELRNADLANSILPSEHAVYQVMIAVDQDRMGHLHWSFGKPANVDVSVGTLCSIMTETYRRSIVEYMFERVKSNENRVKEWVD